MTSLATYVIPFTLISRVYGMLFRLPQGMFPLASALAAAKDFRGLQERYAYVMRYTFYINVCVCLLMSAFATEILHYWLKGGVGGDASLILVIVAYSLLAESLTNLPSMVNDGLGRPHITGIAALARAVVGVAAAWWALSWGGIVALAMSQLVVSVLASLIFVGVVHRLSMPWRFKDVAGPAYGVGVWLLAIGSPLVALRLSSAVLEPWSFACAAAGSALLLGVVGWFLVLLPVHRQQLVGLVLARFARPLPRG
jgi:O-antigen/teichoic acid export membrane protein